MNGEKSQYIKQLYIGLMVYTLLFWLSKELARPTISLVFADLDMSSEVLGTLLSLQNVLPLILSIPLATFGDKLGQDKILHLGSMFTVVSGIMFVLTLVGSDSAVISVVLITAGQILSGIAWTASWISLQALVSECDEAASAAGREANGVNRMILIMSIGMVLGPLISGYIYDSIGAWLIWVLNLAFCAAQFVISARLRVICRGKERAVVPKKQAAQKRQPVKRIYKELGAGIYMVMVLFSFIMMFTSEMRASYFSVILRTSDVGSVQIGYIVSAGSLASCIIRFLMNLFPKFNKYRAGIIFASMGCSLAAFVLLIFVNPGLVYYMPSILIGLCGGMVEPVIITYILENSAEERKGTALAGRVLANRLAMVLAPFLAGILIGILGLNRGFAVMTAGLIMCIGAASAGYINWKRKGANNENT